MSKEVWFSLIHVEYTRDWAESYNNLYKACSPTRIYKYKCGCHSGPNTKSFEMSETKKYACINCNYLLYFYHFRGTKNTSFSVPNIVKIR